jgi:ABC-type molybdate transport system ATPase subunit
VSSQATDGLARVADRAIVLDEGRVALEGLAGDVLADPRLPELGVDPPEAVRLGRMASGAGLDPRLLELVS